jgi:hypothetical protein
LEETINQIKEINEEIVMVDEGRRNQNEINQSKSEELDWKY